MQTAEDIGDEIRIIRHGWGGAVATLDSRRRIISQILVPGDVAGGSVVSTDFRPRTIQAITEIEYCGFSGTFVRELLEERQEVRQLLVDTMVQTSMELQKRLADVALRDAEGRIISLALDIYDRLHTRHLAQNGRCGFPLSQQRIAEVLGLTQVHVSRVLKTLRASGILSIEDMTLHIPDIERARQSLQ